MKENFSGGERYPPLLQENLQMSKILKAVLYISLKERQFWEQFFAIPHPKELFGGQGAIKFFSIRTELLEEKTFVKQNYRT